jgi:hypothetical protein
VLVCEREAVFAAFLGELFRMGHLCVVAGAGSTPALPAAGSCLLGLSPGSRNDQDWD